MSEKFDYDYNKLGFKSGIEIHQQLDTSKLFCECASVLRNDKPKFEVLRKLHAVAGESGEIDAAAEFQAKLNKDFIYQAYDTTCLVELDEEPPHKINSEALKIGLQISLLLNCKIVPVTQIMRKTVIDGSNTSGFQRTVLIAREGYIETNSGRVGIEGVFLEEDSARPVLREEKKEVYRLDRLGIPLVEITTKPDIKNPEQAREVALHIGEILRSCKVKRGIGTIRQDVNMSVKNGQRVEIKGMQDMKIFIQTINREIQRQLESIEKGEKVKAEVRNVLPDASTEFLRPMPGSARMYPETDLPLLKISREMINNAKKNLPRLIGDIKKEFRKQGLSEDMIKLLFKQNKVEEYKQLLGYYNKPVLVAKILLLFTKEVSKKENLSQDKAEELFSIDSLATVLESVKKNKIQENQIKQVLERIAKSEEPEKAIKFDKTDIRDIEEKILKIIKEKPGLSDKAYMGLVMKNFNGQISGKDAIQIIQKLMK